MTLTRDQDSPGDLMATVLRMLEDPATPPLERVSLAVYVAAGGSVDKRITFGDVADVAGIPAADVRVAMFALRERWEAKQQ